MSRYYDRSGKPMEIMEWVVKIEDEKYKRIAFDKTENGEVSTVWLGLDHQFGDGPALIFETMVFGGPMDGDQERYTTEAEALAGHGAMVDRVKSTAPTAKT